VKSDPKNFDPSHEATIGFACSHTLQSARFSSPMPIEYIEAEKGRCLSCGFLAKHPKTSYGALPAERYYEIEPFERTSGNHTQIFRYRPDFASSHIFQTERVCFVHEADLMLGIPGEDTDSDQLRQTRRDLAIETIAFDRHCPAWYPYRPGFSPRGHYQQLQMQRLEHDRREFETRLADMSLTAQAQSESIARESKQLVSDLKLIAEQSDKFSKRITLLVILLAVVQIIVGLMEVFNESYTDALLRRFFGPLP
jgi:hypothetical protein